MDRYLELEKHSEYFCDAQADWENTVPVDEFGEDVAVAYDGFAGRYLVGAEIRFHFVVAAVVGIVSENVVGRCELAMIGVVKNPL